MQRKKYLLIFTVLALILLASLAGMLALVPVELGRSPWERFDLLAVPADQPLQEIMTALMAAGESPLDRYTATVEIENFSGRLEIPVAGIMDHFEPDDPRMDPFLRALPGLFVGRFGGEEHNLVYLPGGDIALGRRYLDLARILGDHSFQLVGWDPLPAIVSGAAALLLMVVTLLGLRRRRWPVILALPAVLAYALAGGPASLVRGSMVVVIWAFWQDRAVREELEWLGYGTSPFRSPVYRRYFLALVAVLFASLFTFRGETRGAMLPAVLAFVLFLLLIASLSAIALALVARRGARAEHRLFLPRPILPVREDIAPRRSLLLVFLILLSAQVSVLLLHRPVDFEVPLPNHMTGEAVVASRVLAEARLVLTEEQPLSIAGYLAHRRYQESLLFGGTFAVPDLDEVVALVRFARDEGRLRDFQEPVMTFDRDWVYRQLAPDPHTAYHLLVHEGTLLIVSSGHLSRTTYPRERVFFLLLAVIVGFAPLVYGLRLPYRSRIGTVGIAS